MNNVEIYFARQNFLWNFEKYFLIGLGIFFIVGLIISWFYDKWKGRKK